MALTKALIVNTSRPAIPVPVMFNPPEYQLQKSNQFAEIGIPGLGSSLVQFVRGTAQTLTMTLFFDTSDAGQDVRLHTALVLALTDLDPATHAPPALLLLWGSLAFPCVLETVTQRFTRFDAAGLPLRAELDVSLMGHDLLSDLLGAIPLLSADKAKQYTVREGDTLAGIAARECDDPRRWREIARANGIDNPLVLAPGTSLLIPRIA